MKWHVTTSLCQVFTLWWYVSFFVRLYDCELLGQSFVEVVCVVFCDCETMRIIWVFDTDFVLLCGDVCSVLPLLPLWLPGAEGGL